MIKIMKVILLMILIDQVLLILIGIPMYKCNALQQYTDSQINYSDRGIMIQIIVCSQENY